MKPATKKILIGSVITLFIVLLIRYGINKTNKLIEVFDKMTIEPHSVKNVNIPIDFSHIKFDLSVLLTNPTNDAFSVSGLGIATLKQINVYYDNVFIATANVILDEISIPANNQLVIDNIPIEVPKPLQFVVNNWELVWSMINNFKLSKITVTGILDVSGVEVRIPQ